MFQQQCESTNGQWRCLTCGEKFPNNLGSSGHAPAHKQRWFCFDCNSFEGPVVDNVTE